MSEKLELDDYHKLAPSREQRAELYIVDDLQPMALETAQAMATDFKNEALPMARTAVLIPVAAHQESGYIFNTLQQYAEQNTTEPFTVFLYLNTPTDQNMNFGIVDTVAQVRRAQQAFPHLDVRKSIGEYDKPVIGEIRDDLWNSVLLLAHHEGLLAGTDADVIGINNDIDTIRISPRYVENIQNYYHKKQRAYDGIKAPHLPLPPRATKLKHAQPLDHPNIGRAIAWVDASAYQIHKYNGYEAGVVLPFSWYTYSGGFDRNAQTYETSSVIASDICPVIPNTLLETSPRRYLDRLGEHGLKGIWKNESFGADDACRNPHEKEDISHGQLEDIIVEHLPADIENRWFIPVLDVAFNMAYNPDTRNLDMIQRAVEAKAARQLKLIDKYLRSVVGSSLLAEMVVADYGLDYVRSEFMTTVEQYLDATNNLGAEQNTGVDDIAPLDETTQQIDELISAGSVG